MASFGGAAYARFKQKLKAEKEDEDDETPDYFYDSAGDDDLSSSSDDSDSDTDDEVDHVYEFIRADDSEMDLPVGIQRDAVMKRMNLCFTKDKILPILEEGLALMSDYKKNGGGSDYDHLVETWEILKNEYMTKDMTNVDVTFEVFLRARAARLKCPPITSELTKKMLQLLKKYNTDDADMAVLMVAFVKRPEDIDLEGSELDDCVIS